MLFGDAIRTDFLLVDHSRTIAELPPLTGVHYILLYGDDDPDDYWVFSVKDLASRLDVVDSTQSLFMALELAALETTPTALSHAPMDAFPCQRWVVLQDGWVEGIVDPGRHASLGLGDNHLAGYLQYETPVTGEQRSIQASFPERIVVGVAASLVVTVDDSSPDRGVPVHLEKFAELTVVVAPGPRLEVVGGAEQTLRLTESPSALRFQLKARLAGSETVHVFAFHGTNHLGTLLLKTIVDAQGETCGFRVAEADLTPCRPPDLTLCILERHLDGVHALEFLVTSAEHRHGFNHHRFPPLRLQCSPQVYFSQLFERVDESRFGRENTVDRILACEGLGLFEELLPKEVQHFLWNQRDHLLAVHIQSEEPWIPWELLKLTDTRGSPRADGPFLCEAFALTRWLPSVPVRPSLSLRRLGLISPANSGLPMATDEAARIEALLEPSRSVTRIPATWKGVCEALREGAFPALHFIGHGNIGDSGVASSHITLEDGPFSARSISGASGNLGRSAPFVFFNACKTNRAGLALTGAMGWADRFIKNGAAAFIGAQWSVGDRSACRFSGALYEKLLAGMSLAEATRQARMAVRQDDPATHDWLAYTVYGAPSAKVVEE